MAAVLGKTGTKVDVWNQKPEFIRKVRPCCDTWIVWKLYFQMVLTKKCTYVFQLSESKYRANSSQSADGERLTFLIIGPASVLYNWVDELETWGHFTVG